MSDIDAENLSADFFSAPPATENTGSTAFDDGFFGAPATDSPSPSPSPFDDVTEQRVESPAPEQTAPVQISEQVVIQEVKPSSFGGFESGPIQKWQNEHTELLARKAAAASAKHQEIVSKAQKETREFLEKRQNQIDNTHKGNRDKDGLAAQNREKPVAPGEEWGRVGDLVDFKAKNERDTSRMKSVLVALKH